MTKTLVVVAGPTAVGKTAVAIKLATRLQCDIISADSRQIYSELEIGTARPSPGELATAKHHFIATRSISDDYTAGQYGEDALQCINALFSSKEHVILCGGSGLYIKAVCDGFDDLPKVDADTRKRIWDLYAAKGLGWLQERVRESDPEFFSMVDQRNPHRLLRALELFETSGKPLTELRQGKTTERPFRMVKVGLDLPRQKLYEQIDRRTDDMFARGLVDEARRLYPLRDRQALQTVGYREVFRYLDGEYDLAEAVRLVKRNTRHYAKRQLTWFKKDPNFSWFSPDDFDQIATFVSTMTHG